MSEFKNASATLPAPESQRERWMKYGSNVVLTVVVVVVLGVFVTALAQSHALRGQIDTTAEGSNTLKPQTVSIIKGLDGHVRLIGLYPKPKEEREREYYNKVSSVLDDYQRQGRNITAEMIDPNTEPAKVDALIATVSKQGGGQEKMYIEFLDEFDKKTLPQIDKFANEQYQKLPEAISTLPHDDQGHIRLDMNLIQTVILVQNSVQKMPDDLQELQKSIAKNRNEKIPNYKGAVDAVKQDMRDMSDMLNAVSEQFTAIEQDPHMPAAFKDYAKKNQPAFDATKKVCDDLVSKIKDLGDLKALDQLRQNIKTKSIVVLTDKDMQVIPHESVWRLPENKDPTRPADPDQAAQKLRFVGEQAINAAIISLTEPTKPTVAFIRASGAPLTEANGPFNVVAERLKQNGFTVVEHDASGMAAAQAQMGGQPPPADATPEQLKDAIWVVFNYHGATIPMGGQMMGPGGGSMPNPLAAQLADHLKGGGSALVMFFPAQDPFTGKPSPPDALSSALKDWGVEANTDARAVHGRLPRPPGRPSGDFIERARRAPNIFVINEFGDHPIVNNLNSLDGLLLNAMPVKVSSVAGYKGTPLLPVPLTPRSWGERNWDSVNGDAPLDFHDKPSAELEKQIQHAAEEIAGAQKDAADLAKARQALSDAVAKKNPQAADDAAHSVNAVLDEIKQRVQRMKDEGSDVAFDTHPEVKSAGEAIDPAAALVDAAARTAQKGLEQADANRNGDVQKALDAANQVGAEAQNAAGKELEIAQKLSEALQARARLGNDIPNEADHRLYVGAAVEKENGGRLVVLGNASSSFNDLINIPDPDMEDQKMAVLRFPANGELFTNSVNWLGKRDRMLALSPAAVQVNRLQVSPATVGIIRVLVLIGGLPLLALASGFVVFSRRRD